MVATPLTGQYHNAVGRRKTAIARVRLYPGTGEMVVNGKEVRDYFGGRELHQITIGTPLRITNTADRFLVSVEGRWRRRQRSGRRDPAWHRARALPLRSRVARAR